MSQGEPSSVPVRPGEHDLRAGVRVLHSVVRRIEQRPVALRPAGLVEDLPVPDRARRHVGVLVPERPAGPVPVDERIDVRAKSRRRRGHQFSTLDRAQSGVLITIGSRSMPFSTASSTTRSLSLKSNWAPRSGCARAHEKTARLDSTRFAAIRLHAFAWTSADASRTSPS